MHKKKIFKYLFLLYIITMTDNNKICEMCKRTENDGVNFTKYRKICNSCNSKKFNETNKKYFIEYYHKTKTTTRPKGRPRKLNYEELIIN